jgi:hypothetical protein
VILPDILVDKLGAFWYNNTRRHPCVNQNANVGYANTALRGLSILGIKKLTLTGLVPIRRLISYPRMQRIDYGNRGIRRETEYLSGHEYREEKRKGLGRLSSGEMIYRSIMESHQIGLRVCLRRKTANVLYVGLQPAAL